MRGCYVVHPGGEISRHAHVALMLFGEAGVAGPGVVEAVDDEVTRRGEDGAGGGHGVEGAAGYEVAR